MKGQSMGNFGDQDIGFTQLPPGQQAGKPPSSQSPSKGKFPAGSGPSVTYPAQEKRAHKKGEPTPLEKITEERKKIPTSQTDTHATREVSRLKRTKKMERPSEGTTKGRVRSASSPLVSESLREPPEPSIPTAAPSSAPRISTKKPAIESSPRLVVSRAMRQVAEEMGFAKELTAFNEQAVAQGTSIHLDIADSMQQPLIDEFIAREKQAIKEKGMPLTQEERTACARKLIQEEKILERKLLLMGEIEKMNLSKAEKLYAKDAVIRNDYSSLEAFKTSYFRGTPPQEMRTRAYGKKAAPITDYTNPSLSPTISGISAKKYEDGTYDPRKFFRGITVDPRVRPTAREWVVHRSILRHFASAAQISPEMKTTLMQRSIGFLSKFANMYDPQQIGVQASPIGREEHNYFRSNVTSLTQDVARTVADSIGVNKDHVQLVTDSRVMEVVKRNLATVEGSRILDWNEGEFTNIIENLDKSDSAIFLDITKFMAATCFGHTHSPEEIKQAIQLVNEFMTSSLETAVDIFVDTHHAADPAEMRSKLKERLKEKLHNQLILGSMINVGEHTALYTSKLCFRHPQEERLQEGLLSDEEALKFKDIVNHNGFTVGPNQLIDNWLRSAPTLETVNVAIDEKTGTQGVTVKFPENPEGIASFESFDEFTSTQIFNQFRSLSQATDAPPYVKILTETTVALLEGLKKEEVFERFEKAGLTSLLQLSLNKMQAYMQDAIDGKSDLLAFSNQIQLIHAEISTILSVAEPMNADEFSSLMQNVTDMVPDGFPDELRPQFLLKNSGMRCLSSVLTGCEQLKKRAGGSEALQIAVQKDSYYESSIDLQSARAHSTRTLPGKVPPKVDLKSSGLHATHILKGRDFSASVSTLAQTLSQTKGSSPKIDLYVCEFHHNISNVLEEYSAEDVKGQVDALFQNGMVSQRFTVAIDVTMNKTDDPEVKAFLDHNKARIQEGKLNVVFYRSAQKFDLMGTDGYNGGIMGTVNNGTLFGDFNAAVQDGPEAQDRLSRYNQQGLAFYQKYAQRQLNEYRQAAMNATRKLGTPQSDKNPLGMPPDMFATPEKRGRAMLQLAPNQDPNAVFLDLRNPWMTRGSKQAEEFYSNLQMLFLRVTQTNPKGYSIEARPSFGFNHSNVSLIGGEKFRFNPGLESDEALTRYRDLFVVLNNIFQVAAQDYQDPDKFNAINIRLSNPACFMTLVELAQKKSLTKSDRLELARIYAEAGNYKAARRELATIEKMGNLTKEQLEKAKDIQKVLRKEPSLSPQEQATRLLKDSVEIRTLLHEGGVDKIAIWSSLGKAFEAAKARFKDQSAMVFAIRAMVCENFSRMSPPELLAISKSAADATKGLDENDPRKMLLDRVAQHASEVMTQKLPQYRQSGAVDEEFFQILNIRPRPASKDTSAQHMLGDFFASVEYYATPEKERKALQGGDKLLDLDEKTPKGALLKAYVGFFFTHSELVTRILQKNDPKVEFAAQTYLSKLSGEAATHSTRRLSDMMSLLNSGAMRKMYISFRDIMTHAEKNDSKKFTKECEVFLKTIQNSVNELDVIGSMFTDEQFLKKVPSQDRATFKQLGAQYLEVAKEMRNPKGICSLMQQFFATAKTNPDKYMKQLADKKKFVIPSGPGMTRFDVLK